MILIHSEMFACGISLASTLTKHPIMCQTPKNNSTPRTITHADGTDTKEKACRHTAKMAQDHDGKLETRPPNFKLFSFYYLMDAPRHTQTVKREYRT